MSKPKVGAVGTALQSAHKSLEAFSKEHPEFLTAAREAIRPWEESKELLLGAVAKALFDMYAFGADNVDLRTVYLQPTANVPESLEEDDEEEDEAEEVVAVHPVVKKFQERAMKNETAAQRLKRIMSGG